MSSHTQKKKYLASCVAAIAAMSASANSMSQELVEEVIVTGIRAAQETAVNVKREAGSIVDAISAEDIGKLPDVTISDSLQRITGVQILREAGEGGAINVRGSGQVLTTLNGESYLGANSITNVQPNLNDVPSQLFNGATVVKAQQAIHTQGGMTGIVDLKTYRPFDFDDGLTVSGAIEASQGMETKKSDPSFNGLLNFNNEQFGILGSLSYSEKNLANYYSGMAGGGSNAGWSGFAGEDWAYSWVQGNSARLGEHQVLELDPETLEPVIDDESGNPVILGYDLNNDGDVGDTYWAYQGHAVNNRFVERQRTGANLSFQTSALDAFEIVAEVLYTDLEEFDRTMGLHHSDKWSRWGWFEPTEYTDQGVLANGRSLSTVQVYTGNGRRVKSYSQVSHTQSNSTNLNLEVDYDNGGPLTGKFRYVHGDAEQERLNSNFDIDLANGSQWGVEFQDYPEGNLATNPGGYAGFPTLTVDYSGANPRWRGFNNNANLTRDGVQVAGTEPRSIASYLEDINSYSVGALTSENNFLKEGAMDVIRFDGSFTLDNSFITSIDFGIRHSDRNLKNNEFDLLSPLGPDGCGVKWKATDVTLNGEECHWGNGEDPETFYTAAPPTPISTLEATQVSDLGQTSGIPTFWTIDAASMDDIEAYHNRLYPGTYRGQNPGRSYEVDLEELSYHAQVNFDAGRLTGNVGLRFVDMDLSVFQNEVGLSNDYGQASDDVGDITVDNNFSEVLPSLNLSYDVTEDVLLRFATGKTLSPLDLNQWGESLDPDFALDSQEGSPTQGQFIVIGANQGGNPELDPWSSTNVDLSLEWYVGTGSVLSLGLFKVDIDSFVVGSSEMRALPDADGVVRREVSVGIPAQGDGATLKGLEVGAKVALADFIEGPLNGFGFDVNYTFSPSEQDEVTNMSGGSMPFPNNSEEVMNLVGWYEKGPFQARIALNNRSERLVAQNQTWGEGALWQESTTFVDVSASYDILDQFTIFINGSNITGEKERYYLEYKDQHAWQNEFETRYTVGVRATF